MAVNDYLRNCKYNLNNLDNYIYLYEFDEPILNYITDDEESNASSINLNGSAYRLFAESVQYSSTSSVDNRFSFDNTLTVTLAESKEVTHYKIIQTLLTNNWMVVFKNTDGDAFVVNAEFPVMVSYNYVFNDEKTPNLLTITFRALQNVPTINYRGSVAFSSTLRDKPCEYSISRIESLKMIDMNKADVDVEGDGFNITEKGEGNLKTIEFNPTSLSFTDSYDGREFSQQLSFQIPFDSYRFYFHYNLLEYLDNRYYALIKTTNGNNILGGFRQGLFPSYTVSTFDNGNLITINLNAKYTTYSVLGSDTMSITTNDGMTYKPILGECINNVYTYTLIEQINANGVPTNAYYCLEGFEDVYSDYTILGTYKQFDTTYGFKLTDFCVECAEGCKINGLPSSIQFKSSGETQCFQLDVNCSVVWEWNDEAITVDWDEITQQLCVTSKVDEGTFSIKGTTTDGTIQYTTTVIGSGGITGDTTTTINITAEAQTVSVIPTKGLNNVKSITSTLQYVTNQNNNGYSVTVGENPNEESRTFTITIIYNDNSIETINIIQDRIYYKIISTEETECFGNDLYYINKKYKGYKETDINIFVENMKGNIKDNMSPSCFTYDTREEKQKVCLDEKLYSQIQYIKDDIVIKQELQYIEDGCDDADSRALGSEYRINTGITECVDGVAYYVEELWAEVENDEWIKVYPISSAITDTIAEDSNACDVIDPDNPDGTVLYRWVDTNETYCLSDGQDTNCTSSTTTTYCDGYNLYEQTTYYVDALCNGNFVQSGSPINQLIQENSLECGYEEDTSGSTSGDTSGSTSGDTTGCTSSTTYDNYQMLAIGVNDMNGNGLGGFAADGGNTINTNLTVAWNESIIIDECSYTYDTTVINSDCTSSTTENTGTTFTTTYSTTENSSTEYKEFVTITIKTGTTTIGNVFFYRNQKPSDTGTTGNTSGDTSGGTEGSGSTTGSTSGELQLTITKDSTFKLNNTTYSAKTSDSVNNGDGTYTYTTTLNDLGITELTALNNAFPSYKNYIVEVNKIPDASNVTNMSGMFANGNLTVVNLSGLNTSKVTTMENMFSNSSGLTSLDLSSFDTSNVTTMSYMFNGCSSLTSLNLNSFNTSKVTTMQNMFYGCSGLSSLDLSNINGINVSNMQNMFYNCSGLTSLNLSNFSYDNKQNIKYLVNGCSSLQILNLTNFNIDSYLRGYYTYNGSNYTLSSSNLNIFTNCNFLNKLILGSISQSAYNWWVARLNEAGISPTIEYTII